jgi:hypothetical protein
MTCPHHETRGDPRAPWHYCQLRAKQVTPLEDCTFARCRTSAAIAAKLARKDRETMAAAENIRPAAPPKKSHTRWDAPANEANPDWPDTRTAREHARILVEAGRAPQAIADDLGIKVTAVWAALKPPTATKQKPARQPRLATADVTGGGTGASSSPSPEGTPSAVEGQPAAAPSADWVVARELVAAADKDDLAEFFAAYNLTDRFEAFALGLRRGRRTAA